jgi:hypothetical protein
MTRLVRYSSAALGMVLLAGLASYQGHMEVAPGEEDILSGTALVEAADVNKSDCESMAGLDDQGADDCAESEQLSSTN